MRDWLRRLPPNLQGALWLVSGGFIFTSTGVMIRLLSEQIESVQTAFFRAILSVVMLLPLMMMMVSFICFSLVPSGTT